ncbi:MAG: PilZ domain-containing protein [Rhodoferax sp.]|uniref:PilZ domain-containing protein n=1 Tax=Rhodoferax sp. TaxID=50421 RepID=UPI0027356E7C|nr:PilZ domain-containing protein [Rhodoferax sp.]MDP2679956.1 PilZ domain-containing protein [Rhodoferax sp.]
MRGKPPFNSIIVNGSNITRIPCIYAEKPMHPPFDLALTMHFEPRIHTSKLKVAVVHKRWIGKTEREFCDLLNISHGGIGLSSPWLNARPGQKLCMELYYHQEVFTTRGIVTNVNSREKSDLYGVAFTFAPPELDRLIDIFKREHLEASAAHNTPNADPIKRHFGKRIATQNLQVQVKKLDSSAPYVLCEVDNINKGGMGFYAPELIHPNTPFDVSIQISKQPDPTIISGKVHYMQQKLGGYYYGVEFKMISLELSCLLDEIETILQQR